MLVTHSERVAALAVSLVLRREKQWKHRQRQEEIERREERERERERERSLCCPSEAAGDVFTAVSEIIFTANSHSIRGHVTALDLSVVLAQVVSWMVYSTW